GTRRAVAISINVERFAPESPRSSWLRNDALTLVISASLRNDNPRDFRISRSLLPSALLPSVAVVTTVPSHSGRRYTRGERWPVALITRRRWTSCAQPHHAIRLAHFTQCPVSTYRF